MYKNGNVFIELEKQGISDGLFMDPEVITAVQGYSAVKFIVSSETKRISRTASASTVEEATENAGIMALSAYFGKEIPDTGSNSTKGAKSNKAAEQPAGVTSKNTAKDQSPSTTGAADSSSKNEAPAQNPTANNDTNKDAAKQEKAENTTTPAAAGTDDDFRVLVGAYKDREDNFITQMLGNDTGRDFLKKITRISSPSPNIKPYVDRVKAYLEAHNISL